MPSISGRQIRVLPAVDDNTCRLTSDLPHCPHCGKLARPNILMFGDWGWVEQRTVQQQARLDTWRRGVNKLVVVELGAGIHIPTVRWFGETLGVPLIRINPDEAEVGSARGVSLPSGALAALTAIDAGLKSGYAGGNSPCPARRRNATHLPFNHDGRRTHHAIADILRPCPRPFPVR